MDVLIISILKSSIPIISASQEKAGNPALYCPFLGDEKTSSHHLEMRNQSGATLVGSKARYLLTKLPKWSFFLRAILGTSQVFPDAKIPAHN